MDEANLPELPEEIYPLILCCLPVKSLIRFTCVSKSFHSLILSDPKFAKSQFQAARDRKSLTRRLLCAPPKAESIDLETPAFGNSSSAVTKLKVPFEDVHLLGSCNGIVLVVLDNYIFYMWNPSTGFWKKLPDREGASPSDNRLYSGFGYLPAMDDYRVFASYFDYTPDDDEIEVGTVFSSRANTWETFEYDELAVASYEGVLVNETLHWHTYYHEIVAFDLAQQQDYKMRKTLLPKYLYDKGDDIQLSGGERLHVVRVATQMTPCIDVWVMTEYGSWTKLFNLKFSGPPKERWRHTSCSVWVMETSTVFSIFTGDRDELVMIIFPENGHVDEQQDSKMFSCLKQEEIHSSGTANLYTHQMTGP
ncbi:F-box/kelch-repeat protein At3g06240-like [Argentina anserina]|uniref:F-box/kelch-repeat protein At3g06240-like n=1 Tax=Argentina anserina TaxID=57926 RepID=UPI002176713C|nr:F-box/kelch-repeat protein At3g06240-like [Potentilla anserina]